MCASMLLWIFAVSDEGMRDSNFFIAKKTTVQSVVFLIISWLGWRDSNPRMPGPEPGALPLGDTPSADLIIPLSEVSLKGYYG